MITCTDFVKKGDGMVEVHAEGRKLNPDEKPPKVQPPKWHSIQHHIHGLPTDMPSNKM